MKVMIYTMFWKNLQQKTVIILLMKNRKLKYNSTFSDKQ